MEFYEFVAIKVLSEPRGSIAYKALKSFLEAVKDQVEQPFEDVLKLWIVTMIDKGLSVATRKRYFEKLNTYYRQFISNSESDGSNSFSKVRDLIALNAGSELTEMMNQCARITKIIPSIQQAAKTQPELAIFLYCLLNASSDLRSAIMLRTENYEPVFAQLDEIIDINNFHHRRKYVFPLEQSRKRMPQLVKEVTEKIDEFLSSRGVKLDESFSPSLIPVIWVTKARTIGLKLSEIKSVIGNLPAEYSYLNLVKVKPVSPDRVQAIKVVTANAFVSERYRWYALKIRRSSSFDNVKEIVETHLPNSKELSIFYPTRDIVKRVGKRSVKQTVPYLPDIVFLKTRQRYISIIDRNIKNDNAGWVFRQNLEVGSDYSIIDRSSMIAFQKAIGELTTDIKMELTKEEPIGVGRNVRITGGVLSGYTGQIYDIKDKDDVRLFYIRLSKDYGIKMKMKVEEYFVEAL